MIISQTAKTYAKGLIQSGNTDSYNSLSGDLDKVKNIVNNSTDLKSVLNSPAVTVEQKCLIIEDVFKNEIDQNSVNFLKLLAEKGRFAQLEEIIEAFNEELDDINHIKHVKVVSAIELTQNYKDKITLKLKEKLNYDIKATWEVNSDIIGGLVIYIDDNTIDTSIKNKLDKLSNIKGNI